MTKYEQYLQITQASAALLDSAWSISRLAESYPFASKDRDALLTSLMLGSDPWTEWEKQTAKNQRRSVKLLFADYVVQRDELTKLLKETV
jgi:hypothetical protein